MENVLINKGFIVIAYLVIPIIIGLNLQRKSDNDELLSRIDSQLLKGVSAILIVLHHLSQRIGIDFITLPFIEVGKYSVSLFLFLSGYGVMISYINNKDYMRGFLRKRVLGIYIPFIISNIIFIIIYKSEGRVFSLVDIIKYTLGIKIIDPVMWFIFTIIVFYLIFYISFKYTSIRYGKIIFSLGSILYLILGIILNLGTTITNISFAFWGGIMLAIYKERFINFLDKRYIVKVILSICVLGITRVISVMAGNIFLREVVLNISTLTYSFLIIILSKRFKLNGKSVAVLGAVSFEVYLLHNKLISLIPNINKSIISISVYFIILIILSYIFKKINSIVTNKFITINLSKSLK